MIRGTWPITTVLQPHFSASGGAQNSRISQDFPQAISGTLSLYGVPVDEIELVRTVWESQAYQRWLKELMEFSRPDSTPLSPHHLGAVWRTAVADREIR